MGKVKPGSVIVVGFRLALIMLCSLPFLEMPCATVLLSLLLLLLLLLLFLLLLLLLLLLSSCHLADRLKSFRRCLSLNGLAPGPCAAALTAHSIAVGVEKKMACARILSAVRREL